MAYGLKYRSNFYNAFGTYVEVQISKRDYVSTITDIRSIEVFVEFNFQGNDVPVHGTGAWIVLINQQEYTAYEDLLISKEKEFWCVIKYNSNTVFQGFSICDLNEQQFNYLPRIKIQFTDYLKRLDERYMPNFFVGSDTDLLTIVQNLYIPVGFGSSYELYVNSTLFEQNQNIGSTDTFLKQTYAENNMFFKDASSYDSVYEMVNKTLKSFGAFMYSYGDKWVIERQEDILRGGGAMDPWVKYTYLQVASSLLGLKQELNKQLDFDYVDMSQILEYNSGLKTLIINLQDKQLDTLVFNDYALDIQSVTDQTPDALGMRQWFKFTDVSILAVSNNFRDMTSYVKWTYPMTLDQLGDFATMGLYYEFEVEFADAMGNVSEENPTILNVGFKMTSDFPLLTGSGDPLIEKTQFALRIDGGTQTGKYVVEIPSPGGTLYLTLGTALDYNAIHTDTFTLRNNQDRLLSVSRSWDMTSDQILENAGGAPPFEFPGLWAQLGKPTRQKFILYIFPSYRYLGIYIYNRINYLGDVEITISQQKILNKLTYYINEDFVKTLELSIDLFDLTNVNFANGLMYGLGGIGNSPIGKTQLWTTMWQTTPIPLMDILAQTKFRNYARTIHKLKGTIRYDGHIKPFAVITDDDRPGVNLLVQGYTWDLFNGTYELEAEEYTSEEITVDGSTDPGAGGDGTAGALTAPTNVVLDQPVVGLGVDVSWNSVVGATAYILQRQPFVDGYGNWVNSWKTIYQGGGTNWTDDIQNEYSPMPNSLHLMYRVAALNAEFYGPYTPDTSNVIIWMKI